jgi:hypothetical protein
LRTDDFFQHGTHPNGAGLISKGGVERKEQCVALNYEPQVVFGKQYDAELGVVQLKQLREGCTRAIRKHLSAGLVGS